MAEQSTPVENTPEPVAPAPVTPAAAVPAPAVPAPAPAVVVEADKPVPVIPAEPTPAPIPADPVQPTVTEEKYDLKFGTEGVNPQLLQALTPLFKEAGVTTKQAQGLADAFEAHRKAMIPQIMARDLDTLRADPELGKLNFGRTQARVNDALAAFTTPQERTVLEGMGLANNLTLVRMFHRIGASMQDAPQTEAGPRVQEKLPTHSKLYGGKDRVSSGTSN